LPSTNRSRLAVVLLLFALAGEVRTHDTVDRLVLAQREQAARSLRTIGPTAGRNDRKRDHHAGFPIRSEDGRTDRLTLARVRRRLQTPKLLVTRLARMP